uniref:aspartate-semialdehyde dehydrogenase n=1 Tax=Albugo laibachii Nc14 TaxID=890382 RepID=F0WGM4_9STRA|nr:unnamed protein product [Albugo laibachii Nc14]|eukprot:CCA20388.1 unnamed protein product [Albugo laibachii Nc14]
MDPNGKSVGICGATGAVGLEILSTLIARKFPLKQITLFASSRSTGKTVPTSLGDLLVEEFSKEKALTLDFVFLAVSGDFSLQYAKELANNSPNGPYVIDNSSAFRYDPEIPLIVPEVNGEKLLTQYSSSRLIANPNCTTAIAVMALWPLHCDFGIKKMIISTYQAASGAGVEGMQELKDGTAAYLDGITLEAKVFAYPLAFNLIPQIDKFQSNGYTKEEMKVTWETRKIFDEPKMAITCTAVRVPIMRAHSEAITIETARKITPESARVVLEKAQGVLVVDVPNRLQYPMPINASSKNNVQVGRIRQSLVFGENGLELFVSGDQLLRGAALNAVLIAEFLEHPHTEPQCIKKTSGNTCPFLDLYKMKWSSRRSQVFHIAAFVGGIASICLFIARRRS